MTNKVIEENTNANSPILQSMKNKIIIEPKKLIIPYVISNVLSAEKSSRALEALFILSMVSPE